MKREPVKDDEQEPWLPPAAGTQIDQDGHDVKHTLKQLLSKMDDQFREIKETLYVSADACGNCIHDSFRHSTHIHLFILVLCMRFSFAKSDKVLIWKILRVQYRPRRQ